MKLTLALAAGTVAATTMTLTASAATGSTPTTGADGPFATMLSMAPEQSAELGSSAYVQYVDMAALWRRAGVEGGADERTAAFREISFVDSFPQPPALFGTMMMLQDSFGEVGFAFQHIEQEIAVMAPPDNLIVAVTSAPVADVVGAVETDPVWSADLSTVSTDHGDYFSWGDDGARLEIARRSSFRPLGQPGFLGVLGDADATVVRTIEAPTMVDALATIDGSAPSLADGWLFAPVIEAIADREVLFATAVPTPTLADPLAVISPDELLSAASLPAPPEGLVPYLGVVIVGSVAADGTGDVQTDILLVHLTPESAAENVARAQSWLAQTSPRVNAPYSELLPGATVSSEGTLLRVTVPGQLGYQRAQNLLFSRELLPIGA